MEEIVSIHLKIMAITATGVERVWKNNE